jgi:hypothetical protein
MEWKPISTAPFDRDLELAVIDTDGPHALVFPCRRTLGGWLKVWHLENPAPFLPGEKWKSECAKVPIRQPLWD